MDHADHNVNKSSMRENDDRMRNIFNNIPIGMFQSTVDGKFIYVNRAMPLLFGYDSPQELMDTVNKSSIADVLYEDPTRRPALVREVSNSSGESWNVYEVRYRRKDCSILEAQLSFCRHQDPVTGEECLYGFVQDVSGQKRAREMAIENGRLEAVRAVARGVGSNFTNILNVINSYAASIADSFLPNTRPHESAMEILAAVRHATDLTRRLLGVVRVSGSDDGVHLEPVALLGSVQKAYELIAPTLQERGISFDMPPIEADVYVLADAGQILDVLMNVFLNGSDAMPQGGSLVVRLAERVIRKNGSQSAGVVGEAYVEVLITDSGIGMSAEQVSHMFEPFYTTKKDKEAFGLGLPVAQSMVKSWGGWIDVRSELGRGTNVCIMLPRADSAPQGASKVGLPVLRTVLIVDDHPGRRRMMRQVLLAEGCSVIEAHGGAQAISLYKERSSDIDLTVLDWIMPGVDGREVLKVIHDRDPEGKVLMTSGFSRDYVRSQIRMGAWAFLQKPFSKDQFRVAVRKALDIPAAKIEWRRI